MPRRWLDRRNVSPPFFGRDIPLGIEQADCAKEFLLVIAETLSHVGNDFGCFLLVSLTRPQRFRNGGFTPCIPGCPQRERQHYYGKTLTPPRGITSETP